MTGTALLLRHRGGEGWGDTMYDDPEDVIEFPGIGACLAVMKTKGREGHPGNVR
jgi:hypothetical protein